MKDHAELLKNRSRSAVFQFLVERLALLFFAALIILQSGAVYEMIRTFVR